MAKKPRAAAMFCPLSIQRCLEAGLRANVEDRVGFGSPALSDQLKEQLVSACLFRAEPASKTASSGADRWGVLDQVIGDELIDLA